MQRLERPNARRITLRVRPAQSIDKVAFCPAALRRRRNSLARIAAELDDGHVVVGHDADHLSGIYPEKKFDFVAMKPTVDSVIAEFAAETLNKSAE